MSALKTMFVLFMLMHNQVNATQTQTTIIQNSIGETMNTKENLQSIIENFYRYFNNEDLPSLLALIADDVTREINHDGVEKGKQNAAEYFTHSFEHYKEQVSDVLYMTSDDGRFVTAKFVVNGQYLKTDESGIPATGQKYKLDVFNYFEIRHNQIVDAKCFFDEAKLMEQLTK